MESEAKVYCVSEVAAELKRSPQTVYEHIYSGVLRAYKDSEGHWLIRQADLDEYCHYPHFPRELRHRLKEKLAAGVGA